MDLADEVRLRLGAFLCPRVGLLTGRYWCTYTVNDISGDLRSTITHRWLRDDLNLTRTKEHAMVGFTSEVLDAADCSVILADWFTQLDTDPFTTSE